MMTTNLQSQTFSGIFKAVASIKPLHSYFILLGLGIIFYSVCCAPGVLWQDSGMYQYRIQHNDIEGKLGLALAHPLYHIIGIAIKHFPFGRLAYKVNLISAIAAALTVANVFLLLRLWVGRNLPAVVGALTLALSWNLWQHACIAEVYTLYLALFSAELLILFKYVKTKRVGFLYLLALLNGLAIANHMWAAIAFVCYLAFVIVLVVKKQIKFQELGFAIILWMLGAAPYEYLILKNIIQTGDIAGTISSAIFGNNWHGAVLNTSLSAGIVKENLIFIAYNFPTPNGLFFFAGLYALNKLSPSKSFRNILFSLVILFFIFAFRYTVPDRYAFFMPFYCLVSILIGLGFGFVVRQGNYRILGWIVVILTLLPIPIYAITPVIAEKMQFVIHARRQIPYRNDYTWFLRPWQIGNYGPELFANEALQSVENNALIYADGTTVYSLLLTQEDTDMREDLTIVSGHGSVNNLNEYGEDVIDKLFGWRAIYVVSPVAGYCPKFLLERFDFKEAGVLYRAVERKSRE